MVHLEYIVGILLLHFTFAEEYYDCRHCIPTIGKDSTPSPSLTGKPSFSPSLTTTPSLSPTIDPRISTTLPSNPPTRSSSMEQSIRPSLLPTNALSRGPSTVPSYSTLTKYPSMLPSNLPFSLPTNKPTDHPSLSPSSQPSNGPSLIPSSELSDSPSLITSSHPSNNPSLIPSKHKSIVPYLDDYDMCQLSTAGFFGRISAREVLINYNYEMDYRKSYDRNEILNNLEYTISSVIVNATIPECRRSRMIQEIEQDINLEDFVVGISSSPRDLFIDEEKCSPQQLSSSVDCSVINGSLTVYIQDTWRFLRSLSEVENLSTVVTEIIANGMKDGDLVYSHEAIVSLRYFSVNNENRIFSTVKGVEQVEVSNEFPTYGWVLLCCTIILFLSMVGIVGRNQALNRHKDDELRVSNVNDDTFLTGDID